MRVGSAVLEEMLLLHQRAEDRMGETRRRKGAGVRGSGRSR